MQILWIRSVAGQKRRRNSQAMLIEEFCQTAHLYRSCGQAMKKQNGSVVSGKENRMPIQMRILVDYFSQSSSSLEKVQPSQGRVVVA